MPQIRRNKEQVLQDLLTQSKICCVCAERKAFEFFYNAKNKNDGKSYRCKECDEKASKKWAENNPKKKKESQRERNLKFKYNLSIEKYETLLRGQKYCCGICGSASPGAHKQMFCVDHSHDTGKIRGLLCNNCNRGVGLLGDTPSRLYEAFLYLEKNK